jgi:hypothetical protein
VLVLPLCYNFGNYNLILCLCYKNTLNHFWINRIITHINYNDDAKDTQHNDIQDNGTQHKGLICDTEHKQHRAKPHSVCCVLFIVTLNVKKMRFLC